MNILVVEDDPILSQNIREALVAEAFAVENVYDGDLAQKILRKQTFDCVVMDVNLPRINGFEVAKNLRSFNTHTPIIMLTAFAELEDKIKGFNNGADDYLTKPFYMRELVLRIQALIKRRELNPLQNTNFLFAGDVSINLKNKTVERQAQNINLTPREFQILVCLCEQPGNVISKNELLRQIWGNAVEANTNTVEVFINLLRNKIDRPFNKKSIKTKVGYGYYFETE